MELRIDKDAVEDLRRSLSKAGEIYSMIICLQHPDRILAGAHRKAAGAKKVYKLDVNQRAKELGLTHNLTELVVRIESNVQRQVGEEERREELLMLAKLLEIEGAPKREIASRMTDVISLSKSRIYGLLPDAYKSPERVEAQREAKSNVGLRKGAVEEPEKPEKKEYGAKGQSPTLRQNLVGEFTPSQMAMIGGLQYLHVPFKSEFRVPVQKWSCGKCKAEFGDDNPDYDQVPSVTKDKGRLCPKDSTPLEQVQFKCDIFVQTNAGFAVSLEVEGEGSSSKDNPERDQLLARANVRVAHVPNEMADKWAEEIAGIVRSFML